MTRNLLITGGAGFIGANYVARQLEAGARVTIYDNLSRQGSLKNLKWLQEAFGKDAFQLIVADIRDAAQFTAAARQAEVIVHLASQVAVTTSVQHPREDFETNAQGTFNMLEAARLSETNPIVLYASTNKVYGGMEDARLVETASNYQYQDYPQGISEERPLDFHSPYGCSKGAGDQYVRDYQRIYGLRTVVFRQSCIYGPHQFGMEDQGWVAWFVIAVLTGKPIVIYGDGKQVRDVLYIDDLLDAYDLAIENITTSAGQVYNIGGGRENTLSIWQEFGPLLEELMGRQIPVSYADWRPGDQRIYVSDVRKAQKELLWHPQVTVRQGIQKLVAWATANRELFA